MSRAVIKFAVVLQYLFAEALTPNRAKSVISQAFEGRRVRREVQARPIANITKASAQVAIASTPAGASKLVLILGASLDEYSVRLACNHAHAPMSPPSKDDRRSFYCSFNGLTLVFAFHPGATSPPYFDGLGTWKIGGEALVKLQLQEMVGTFGKPPDAVIVDSSIWDVANWWQRNGKPQNWPFPHGEIWQWSEVTVPTFLSLVSKLMPHSHIAFRSQPQAFAGHYTSGPWLWTQRINDIVEEMYSNLVKHYDHSTALLYGKYPLLDYHYVVQSKHKEWGGDLRRFYNDEIHPGPELSLAYMAVVYKWVQGL